MFDFLSWGHLVVIALGALFIFGPERLPTVARDAARGVQRARATIQAARGQVHDALGDEFDDLRDLDLRRYHPKTYLREQLFGALEPEDPRPARSPAAHSLPTAGSGGSSVPPRLPPPVDWEAT